MARLQAEVFEGVYRRRWHDAVVSLEAIERGGHNGSGVPEGYRCLKWCRCERCSVARNRSISVCAACAVASSMTSSHGGARRRVGCCACRVVVLGDVEIAQQLALHCCEQRGLGGRNPWLMELSAVSRDCPPVFPVTVL